MAERFNEQPIEVIVGRDGTSTMVDALRGAHECSVQAPCLVAYGDIVFEPKDVRRLAATEADIAIVYDPNWLAVWTERFGDPLLDAEVFKHVDGQLLEAGGRASRLDDAEGQYIGLLRTTPRGWVALVDVADRASLLGNPVIDVTDFLTRTVRAGQPVGVVPVEGVWWEVDHPTDLELGRARFDHLDRILFGGVMERG